MNRLRILKHYSAASVVLPIAAVLIWRSELWLLVVFVLWLIAAAAIWVICERKEHAYRTSKMVHAMQTTSIRTLNHHRHDWMNDLQVLYGYIRMGKSDRVVQYVEQIRENMTKESKIAKLGIPSLITYLQSFRTMTNSLQLVVSIEEDLNLAELSLEGEQLAAAIVEIINMYRFGVKAGSGEVASLTVAFSSDDTGLQLAFAFEGELNDEKEWQQKWKQRIKGTPLQAIGREQRPEYLQLRAELHN